jgi:hypothetical protein
MDYTIKVFVYTFGLLIGMLLLLACGGWIRRRQIKQGQEDVSGIGSMESAVFALFGLLIAFTFSGAASRLDDKRKLIVEEANAIGTAYLRLDLLPVRDQAEMRENFRNYLDARLSAYKKLDDAAAANNEFARANLLQGEIWHRAVAGSRAPDAHPDAARLLLPALNQMIDITTTRTMAMELHPPRVVFVMLFGFALVSSLLAGYAMGGNSRHRLLHKLCFALVVAAAVFVILDLEYPRYGWIRIDTFDRALLELRASMK